MYKEPGATILCRDTGHSYDKNMIAGSILYRDIIKVRRDKIQEKAQRTGCDRKMQAATEACDKDRRLCRDITFYVATERPIWDRNLGIHNTALKCGPTLESL